MAYGHQVFRPRTDPKTGLAVPLLPDVPWLPLKTGTQRELAGYMTGATKVNTKSITTQYEESHIEHADYDPLERDPVNIMRMLTFHREAGGTLYTGLENGALRNFDWTPLLDLDRAVLIGAHPQAGDPLDGRRQTARAGNAGHDRPPAAPRPQNTRRIIARPSRTARDRNPQAHQALRQPDRRQRNRPQARGRGRLRLHRPQRLGQDDHHADDRHAAQPRLRRGLRLRQVDLHRPDGNPPPGRLHARLFWRVRRYDGDGVPRILRLRLPHQRRQTPQGLRREARTGRHGLQAGRHGQPAFPRPDAAHRPGPHAACTSRRSCCSTNRPAASTREPASKFVPCSSDWEK